MDLFNIDWTAVGNAIAFVISTIVIGIAVLVFIFWAWYVIKKENKAEKDAKEEAEREKKETEEKSIFDKLVKDNNLSKKQEAIFKRISQILKDGINSSDNNGSSYICDFERNINNFDSGNLDHPLIRESIKIVYEKLFERGNEKYHNHTLEIAAEFAKKYNL
jgi:mannitol-specific phosphotransferase system IIBC component